MSWSIAGGSAVVCFAAAVCPTKAASSCIICCMYMTGVFSHSILSRCASSGALDSATVILAVIPSRFWTAVTVYRNVSGECDAISDASEFLYGDLELDFWICRTATLMFVMFPSRTGRGRCVCARARPSWLFCRCRLMSAERASETQPAFLRS